MHVLKNYYNFKCNKDLSLCDTIFSQMVLHGIDRYLPCFVKHVYVIYNTV